MGNKHYLTAVPLWYDEIRRFLTTENNHPYNKIGDGPEGPEIRIIAEYLHKNWVNNNIICIKWDKKSKFARHPIKGFDLIKLPCKVIKVFSRGKVIVIECLILDTNQKNKTIYMISQMGMEGCWEKKSNAYTNLHVYFGDFDIQQEKYIISDIYYFNDVRNFGSFNVYEDLSEVWARHGPCLLTTALVQHGLLDVNTLSVHQVITTKEKWNEHYLKLQRNNRSSKRLIYIVLLEQKIFSSLGNYLVAEILYKSKIRPDRKIEDLTRQDITNLFNFSIEILYKSYTYGGLTIKSFHDPEGKTGKYPRKIYGNKKDPLNNEVLKTKFKNGRTCHWVSNVQV